MRVRTPALVAGLAVAVSVPFGAWATATSAPTDPEAALPELPSVAEQVDGLYDADGCLVTGDGSADCSVRASEVDEALSHGPVTESRQLQGFVGAHWTTDALGAGPVVLEPSLDVAEAGPYTAQGLARNEGEHVLDTLTVTARLLDAEGAELAVLTATSPVHDIRPGEPVPFTLTGDVPAEAVDHVEWSAAGGAEGDPATRALAWTPYWERPVGGEAVDLYLHQDAEGARPYLLFGSVAAVGAGPVEAPQVVIAWLDAEGRLVRTLVTSVRGADGADLARLEAGAAADALVVADADPPVGGEALVWVQGE
jgi:hypothetical protein